MGGVIDGGDARESGGARQQEWGGAQLLGHSKHGAHHEQSDLWDFR